MAFLKSLRYTRPSRRSGGRLKRPEGIPFPNVGKLAPFESPGTSLGVPKSVPESFLESVGVRKNVPGWFLGAVGVGERVQKPSGRSVAVGNGLLKWFLESVADRKNVIWMPK